MRVIEVTVHGGPEVMALVERRTPEPRAGEVLVRVEAAGVNFIDVYHRTGLYKSEGAIRLGKEGAGIVETVGSGVDGIRPGDRVAWASIDGSYATHVVAPPEKLVPIPDGVDTRSAAAAMLQGMTAHYLTRSTYLVAHGDACLVQAAAGGVGLLLCQLAKRAGARVIGTVSSAAKAELARARGLDDAVRYDEVDVHDEVMRLTDGRGVNVVYDSVGRTTLDKSLLCLRPRGMLVSFGQSSGPAAPIDPMRLGAGGSLFLTRPRLPDYTQTREELLMRAGDVLSWVASGALKLDIHAVVPLERAADAHRLLEARATAGKLLLSPR